jgi:hypothetical protein
MKTTINPDFLIRGHDENLRKIGGHVLGGF